MTADTPAPKPHKFDPAPPAELVLLRSFVAAELAADNARLTAALAEAEGERDRLRDRIDNIDVYFVARATKAEAEAATARAVVTRYWDGWQTETIVRNEHSATNSLCPFWARGERQQETESMTPAEAAYLASLSDNEEGT